MAGTPVEDRRPPPFPIPRHQSMDATAPHVKQLRFACSRRSMLEVERILARFLERHLAEMDESACLELMRLLDETDADILDWIWRLQPVPERIPASLLLRLSDCRAAEAILPQKH
ncbi:MAG: succinate dehydrogenase assembly factor 2 [Magnetococcales bacterium]|nr:succinate dehydrogenase assembly factor 2 [Magnetococcales bacterium]